MATIRLSKQDRWMAQWIGRVIKHRSGATIKTIRNDCCERIDEPQIESLLRHLIKEGKAREVEGRFYYVPRRRIPSTSTPPGREDGEDDNR